MPSVDLNFDLTTDQVRLREETPRFAAEVLRPASMELDALTPEEVYVEFEKIHPFEDGNGRVGDLLWKIAMARTTGKWPEELPPDVFGEQKE